MLIAKATIKSSDFGREYVTICTEKEEERLSETGAVTLYNSPLAKEIMKTAVKISSEPLLKRSKRFTVSVMMESGREEVTYTLKKYESVPAEAIYNSFRRTVPVREGNFPEDRTLHLYNGICTCRECYEKYGFDRMSCHKAYFYSDGNLAKVAVPVLRCNVCGEYYAKAEDYRKAASKAGNLKVRTDFVKGEYYRTDDELCEVERKYRNILTNMGYYSFVPKKERHEILDKAVAEYGKKTIIALLREYISDHSVYRPKSNYIWNRDCTYINKMKEHAE